MEIGAVKYWFVMLLMIGTEVFFLCPKQVIFAASFEESLYAQSAVLMDGDSGRVLYGKEENTRRPMASTTKIMTCIVALEKGNEKDLVTISKRAAAQPDVQLNLQEDEQYYLKDLLYSIMLKSHNDSAVAIAEHVGGSVEQFVEWMNQKAVELGCKDTHFVTPNGLDDRDQEGIHASTARDLAVIMRYGIQNPRFLQITQTQDYNFSDQTGKRVFVLHNTNALLNSMEGALSGKTGFTGNAGYCYVCAVKRDRRVFVVSLLACGWPNNRTYKWEDTKKLIDYAFSNYQYETMENKATMGAVLVEQGIPLNGRLFEPAYVNIKALGLREQHREFLLGKDEKISIQKRWRKKVTAPIKEGEVVGSMDYQLNGKSLCSYPIVVKNNVDSKTWCWCVKQLCKMYRNQI